ncbi:sugar ABC transporter permease [Chloroflexi bacterium TSY]|nr:sugar ABC transporter permease [Chloroflexi bacterium TSY]
MAVARSQLPTQPQPVGPIAKFFGLKSALEVREAQWGYIFLLPWVLGLAIFILGPIIVSAFFSVTEYDVLSSPRYIGAANYTKAFFEDRQFWPSMGRTLRYALIVVPVGLVGSLLLAVLLNQGIKGTTLFRTLFFLPSLTPAVALALLWTWLFHPNVGPINVALGWIGIDGPGWLSSKEWALPSIIIISLWASLGGNTMLIFLAGLQGVPQELYEAAEIDGAGSFAKFMNVTLPMISPTLLFNLILGVIGALKVFTLAFVATLGGPSYATWFYALHIYRQAFEYFRMGYGSALAWIFVLLLLFFTYLQMNWSRRWVYYAGESS